MSRAHAAVPGLAALAQASARVQTLERCGRVVRAVGTLIEVVGLSARVGEACELTHPGTSWRLRGEVVGVSGDQVSILPWGGLEGVSSRTLARSQGVSARIRVGPGLLGHVLDGFGQPLTAAADLPDTHDRPLAARPPSALHRRPIAEPLVTGVRAIDGLLTCGRGQRLGIFAPAGTGKSSLLAALAQGCEADVVVLALVGERGREVGESLDDLRQLGLMSRAVVVVATADRPAAERARAPEVAMACAEHFRDEGKSVLLLMDSVTRYARALREIGLAAGEPPARRGYPPTVFTALPRLFERAGWSEHGVITAFFTVLIDDDAQGDPIFEEVRATLDGHIVLSPRLADAGHYPAIDVLASRSRVMQRVAATAHQAAARVVRERLQKLLDVEVLVQIGEYRHGSDAVADAALAQRERLSSFLQQSRHQSSAFPDTVAELHQLAA